MHRKYKIIGYGVVLFLGIIIKQLGSPYLGLGNPDSDFKNVTPKITASQSIVYRHFRDYKTDWKRTLWRFPKISEFLVAASKDPFSNSQLTENVYHYIVGKIDFTEESYETTFIEHAKLEYQGRAISSRDRDEAGKNYKPSAPASNKPSNSDSYKIRTLSNGESPYDKYFGSGRYEETENSVIVKASSNSDVVFILIDVNSGRKIRNEYIRRGTVFSLTKIPYGTYDYMYYSGLDWSDDLPINSSIKGGFTRNSSFTKNSYSSDRLEFNRGYYGSYEITLYEVANGNLETKSASASEFFN